MGFFISDLNNHIAKLHVQQFSGQSTSHAFTVYRDQGLPKNDFDRMVKLQGGLLLFNNFLSTSIHRKVSRNFARQTMETSNLVSNLFVIKIDPSIV
ncbi:unnamed protein product [Rotaria sp. Silwood1]|nr:unnamed protein product [Rotaria sp. Silwood1]